MDVYHAMDTTVQFVALRTRAQIPQYQHVATATATTTMGAITTE